MRDLFVGLDVLLVALVVVTVVQAPPGARWAAVVLSGALLAAYAGGRVAVRVDRRPVDAPRGAWWPDAAWVLALTLLWAALLWTSPGALWVAFPLMLVQMHVLGPRRGVVAVAATTLVAVAEGLLVRADASGSWVGYVLGPVIGGAVTVGVVLGLEAVVRESQARERTLEELGRARRDVARAERERAVATERERLGRDIHDTLAQSLSAIELLLRTADTAVGVDDDRARALIDQARDAARTSLAEARRFVRDLAPADLDGSTLVAALRRVGDRAAAVHGDSSAVPLTVGVRTSGDPRPLPVAVETALLRVTQSALANVVQHAGAEHARVTLTYEPGTVILDVVDDGRGFDPTAPADGAAGGFGIPAMRSRAQELGGTLYLESAPGRGTALSVAVPVPQEAP